MQLIDVLRDQRVQLAPLLQVDQRKVSRVGLRVPGWAGKPVLPRRFSHPGIGEVVVDVGHLLGDGILRPHALRPAEIRDAGIGGDACAAEHDYAIGAVDPGTDLLDQGIWIFPVPGAPGTTMDEAAWRRRSCSSFTVRSMASFASEPNFSAASSSDPAPISNAMGSAPAGVSTCVSPT